jgi:hypothetical protein
MVLTALNVDTVAIVLTLLATAKVLTMSNTISLPVLSTASQVGRRVPVRSWYPSGYRLSVWSSLLAAFAIGIFFIGGAGWAPPEAWQSEAAFGVTWFMLTYIWLQMGSLVVAGAGTKSQMWIDALTSIVPLFLIVYVLLQHYGGFVVISPFQVRAAWATAYTMLLDVVIDLGVTVLLSRQIVDVGGRGT